MKAEFLELYRTWIKRPGADALLDYLENKTDFFTAPASTKFHLSREGGLVEHSVHVYTRLRLLCQNEAQLKRATGDADNRILYVSDETIAICGLLHDVCKVNCYKQDTRNVKKNNVWTQVPYYSYEDKMPYGHGEKSVYIISGFMRLTREEAFAIRYHMGPWQEGDKRNIGNAFELYPLAVLAHNADMQATYLDEREDQK